MITSVEDYVSLVKHDDTNIRRVANMEEATSTTWHAILDQRPDLWPAVAMNKKLPTEIIDTLIRFGCPRTRSLVALKRALSFEQFQRLGSDADESVRGIVANNTKAPSVILKQLVNDEFEFVSEAAKSQLTNRGELF